MFLLCSTATTACGGVYHITDDAPTVTVAMDSALDDVPLHCQWIIHARPGRFISGNTTSFSTGERLTITFSHYLCFELG